MEIKQKHSSWNNAVMSSEVLYFLLLVTLCAFESNAFEHEIILQNRLCF